MPPCSIDRRASLLDFASCASTMASTRVRLSRLGTRVLGISWASASNTPPPAFRGSKSPNRISDATIALRAASPCTRSVTSAASARWASRRAGSRFARCSSAFTSSRGLSEKSLRYARVAPRLHRLLLQHDVHAEVLADVAQEVHQPLVDQPVGVVQHQGPRLFGVEVEEPLHLIALPLQVLADLLAREQRALARLAARVANQSGAAAHQHDGFVAVELEVAQQHQRHEIAELQAGRGRVEAAVHRAPSPGEVLRQLLRGVVHEPAPLELRKEVRHGAESYEKPVPLASACGPR